MLGFLFFKPQNHIDFISLVPYSEPHFQTDAAVAQLDRVPGFEPGCREFESLRPHQPSLTQTKSSNF